MNGVRRSIYPKLKVSLIIIIIIIILILLPKFRTLLGALGAASTEADSSPEATTSESTRMLEDAPKAGDEKAVGLVGLKE